VRKTLVSILAASLLLAICPLLPAQAEAQGMAPLFYMHLKATGIQPPQAVKRQLQGLYLRHRHANQARLRVLRDVLVAFEAAGIQALVLKGAALACLVYAEPALRPMSDLDLLVSRADLLRARAVLVELGFDAPLPPGPALPHRHLPVAALQSEGLLVQVEVHYKLFSNYFDHVLARARWRGRNESAGITTPPRPFALAGLTAHTLAHEDALGHLCKHLASHVNAWESGRLIWMADIVSLAERFALEIDWEQVRRQHPSVLETLSLLHCMTPLSDELLERAGVRVGPAPQGIGVVYQGWPQAVDWQARGVRRVLHDTFFPSEWWLRLRYQLGCARSLRSAWQRWLRHPLYILGHVARALLERLGWPSSAELAQVVSTDHLHLRRYK
jgi:hypothetical protein